jgi:hypothetical protein
MPSVSVTIPFNLTEAELVIDPAAKDSDLQTELEWLTEDDSPWMDRPAELDSIFRSTVALYQAGAGTFAECLHTAIIWERG